MEIKWLRKAAANLEAEYHYIAQDVIRTGHIQTHWHHTGFRDGQWIACCSIDLACTGSE
ncbi:hypothetical protein [Dickeya dianthicola]|uniref:hypothetical protein n=1 Tax=Dickeya dianthicola TaxID=204039 RepID=UPI0003AA9089|nr:hypothetical protein [Dickeya dianthicola]ATO32750.1 Death on curing protein, Doc toxin [Dickeya dianthicola RNS04.9]MCI4002158.1 hypothetical protein [Dickeya dianthicola]MCI4029280.1 hypothetical protein [Dickeya dianthicola]MCI4154291.1 hypothetical protein [Dickeya dianthicola]MCI4173085.1 hypothetical protein [Dickeya dianthicola]